MSSLYVFVGLPGSGKSTIRQKYEQILGDVFVYSTDDYIEARASEQGKTYDEVFQTEISHAQKVMETRLDDAIRNGKNVLWDQTNLGLKKRRVILHRFRNSYYYTFCIAIVPPQTDDEWKELNRRLNNRHGKTIPDPILTSMANNYISPTRHEGFNEIFFYNFNGRRRDDRLD